MEIIKEWLTLASTLGIGATFVLGVVVWAMWRERIEEKEYARKLDRETLDVLHSVTALLATNTSGLSAHTQVLTKAIDTVKETITDHLKRIENNLTK